MYVTYLSYSSNKLLRNAFKCNAFLHIFFPFNKRGCVGLLQPHVTLHIMPITIKNYNNIQEKKELWYRYQYRYRQISKFRYRSISNHQLLNLLLYYPLDIKNELLNKSHVSFQYLFYRSVFICIYHHDPSSVLF